MFLVIKFQARLSTEFLSKAFIKHVLCSPLAGASAAGGL